MPRQTVKTTRRRPKGARAPKPAEADGASSSDRAGRRPPKTRLFVSTDPHLGEETELYRGFPSES
jgi:hypothetical protein